MLQRRADESAVAVVQAHGEGQVVVVSCGAMFANPQYGFRYANIPSAELRRLYEVQFDLLSAAIGQATQREGL